MMDHLVTMSIVLLIGTATLLFGLILSDILTGILSDVLTRMWRRRGGRR